MTSQNRCIFVKPWSKSESKPLSQQAPKLNKSPPKKEKKEEFGPWLSGPLDTRFPEGLNIPATLLDTQ